MDAKLRETNLLSPPSHTHTHALPLSLPRLGEGLDKPKLISTMQKSVKKRRQYHNKIWEKDETHGNLIYGGRLPNTDSDSSVETGNPPL